MWTGVQVGGFPVLTLSARPLLKIQYCINIHYIKNNYFIQYCNRLSLGV